jgi:hypothetical protein
MMDKLRNGHSKICLHAECIKRKGRGRYDPPRPNTYQPKHMKQIHQVPAKPGASGLGVGFSFLRKARRILVSAEF